MGYPHGSHTRGDQPTGDGDYGDGQRQLKQTMQEASVSGKKELILLVNPLASLPKKSPPTMSKRTSTTILAAAAALAKLETPLEGRRHLVDDWKWLLSTIFLGGDRCLAGMIGHLASYVTPELPAEPRGSLSGPAERPQSLPQPVMS